MSGSHPSRWSIFLVSLALTALGCVGTTDTGQQGETGSLSVDLVLADGVVIDQVSWQITGNDMDMSGDVDVSAPGSTASVEVFGLPPSIPGKTDYTVTLAATSTDGMVTCRGSMDFNVEVGESTDVMVILSCKKPRTLGGVRVNGKFNYCAQLTKVVVSPLQTSVGNDISLSAQAFDEEGDPITYIWSGDGGSIDDPTAARTTYTCQEVGEHSVAIMVTDNDVYCRMATWTIPVTCVEGDGGDLCEGVTCDDTGNDCTAAMCNPAKGTCETDNVENGTLCNDDTGTCVNGTCVDADKCEGVTCDDTGNDCTVAMCNPANGTCETSNVENGTLCMDDAGMCVNGDCVVIVDPCEGVICDDTGNDCTVEMCNMDTGICDEMNVTNGTECNGGTGTCVGGTCVDGDPCEGVTCDDTGNDCTVATCNPANSTCETSDVDNGTPCNNDTGTCVNGTCADVDPCEGVTCDDTGNDCTVAMCNPANSTCETSDVDNGTPCNNDTGTCLNGTCADVDPCEGVTCDDTGNDCTVAMCNPANSTCETSDVDNGTPCNNDTGTCLNGTCNPVAQACGSQTKTVSVGCTNNVTTAQSPFPFELTVDVASPITSGGAFTASLDGVGFFPEFFLDAAQGVVCGGLRTAQLVDFVSTVQVRSGATGPDVPLGIDLATLSPGATRFCNFPPDQTCTVDGDCLGGTCEAPILLQDLPVLDGTPNSPGGCDADTSNCPIPGPPTDCDCSACDALGAPKDAQCSDNGFCQDGSLVIQMQGDAGNYTAGASGDVLFGWSDQDVPGLSICPVGTDCGVEPGRVDGCYQLPPASFALPVPPIGIRVDAGGLAVPIQCAMAEDGGTCASGEGCISDGDCGTPPCTGVGEDDDVVCPTPDANLIACPIN